MPKKVLIVGGGYIGVETAGFLSCLGAEVTLLARNSYLKGMKKLIRIRLGYGCIN